MADFGIVMAGGTGSRFWPLSTPAFPKQFHDVLGRGESLLQGTFSRLARFIDAERIVVLTQERYRALVLEQLDIGAHQVLTEPEKKNTAPAIMCGMRHISRLDAQARVFISPADSLIRDEEDFVKRAREALSYVDAHRLITLGITPFKPETGYGYIEFGDAQGALKKVLRFTEKPALEEAKRLLAAGNYLWNAGIFVWSVEAFFTEMQRHAPALYGAFEAETALDVVFDGLQPQSIDCALLEKSRSVFVLPVAFGWSDLGSWDALWENAERDAAGNAFFGAKPLFQDGTGNVVYTQKKSVVISGLRDFVVVETADSLLICPRGEAQRIKSWIEKR